MVRVIQAERIYRLTGHPIWPWEIDELPDDWKDTFRAYAVDVSKKAEKINASK